MKEDDSATSSAEVAAFPFLSRSLLPALSLSLLNIINFKGFGVFTERNKVHFGTSVENKGNSIQIIKSD